MAASGISLNIFFYLARCTIISTRMDDSLKNNKNNLHYLFPKFLTRSRYCLHDGHGVFLFLDAKTNKDIKTIPISHRCTRSYIHGSTTTVLLLYITNFSCLRISNRVKRAWPFRKSSNRSEIFIFG